jgi:hypothetical protein
MTETRGRKPNVKEPIVVIEDEPTTDTEPEGIPVVSRPVADAPEDIEQPWFPGRPCLNCGSRQYSWTVQWGSTCSECSPEAVAAREAE